VEIKENKRFSLSYAISTNSGDSPVKLAIDNSPKEGINIKSIWYLLSTTCPLLKIRARPLLILTHALFKSLITFYYYMTYINLLNQMHRMLKPTP